MKKRMKIQGTIKIIAVTSLAALGIFFGTGVVNARAGNDRGTAQLGEITVTAQKQEENVQDVSNSITVIGDVDIEDHKIESVMDIVDFVPNMMIFNDGMLTLNRVTTRGVSSPTYANYTSSTGMYIDGVPVIGAYGYEQGIISIERIEALRGPQGTLYGKNTEAGAINIITRQPTNAFCGKISLNGGSFLSSESDDNLAGGINFSMNGPIQKDNLYFDLAGVYKHKDGFIKNTFNNEAGHEQDRGSARAKLRWTPTDNLDVSLLLSGLSHETNGGMNMGLSEYGAVKFGFSSPSNRRTSSNLDEHEEMTTDLESLNITYNVTDTVTLTAITARRAANYECVMDFDFSSMQLMDGYQDSSQEKISQELRIASLSKKFEWLVGLYYDTDDNENLTITKSMVPSLKSTSDTRMTGDAYAVFGRLGHALTEKLKLIGGLRYEVQDLELESYTTEGRLDESWEKVSPKISMEYKALPDIMVYADVSQGYRPGGFNHLATEAQYDTYDEETLWSYELGVKTLFMDNRIMLNAAIFHMNITDMQVAQYVDPYHSWNTNAAEATSQGVEIDTVIKIAGGLSLSAGFGYADCEFDRFSDAKGNYDGNKNPYAPEYTFNIGLKYRHANGFYAGADLIGYGKMFLDNANTYARDAYQIVNAKIGYESDKFDIYLYGKNIFDEKYDAEGYFGGYYTRYSDPGEAGVQVTYRF